MCKANLSFDTDKEPILILYVKEGATSIAKVFKLDPKEKVDTLDIINLATILSKFGINTTINFSKKEE